MKLKNNAYTVFMAFLKVLYKRSYEVSTKEAVNLFFHRAPCTSGNTTIRKCILFVLMKFTCIHGLILLN